jgi:hypothetical protein
VLQDVGIRTGNESALNGGISIRVRQHDYAGTGKCCPQGDESLHTGGAAKSHERDIGLVPMKFLDRLGSGGRGRNFLRVRL